jgi:uncharacterized protein YidB (DUF937 family)
MDNVNALLERFGGIEGVMAKLQESGLGDQLSSWIGSGENQAVSPDQIKDALGKTDLDQLASKTGLDVDDLAGRISTKMPDAIDALTPDGKMPEGGLDLNSLTKVLDS